MQVPNDIICCINSDYSVHMNTALQHNQQLVTDINYSNTVYICKLMLFTSINLYYAVFLPAAMLQIPSMMPSLEKSKEKETMIKYYSIIES